MTSAPRCKKKTETELTENDAIKRRQREGRNTAEGVRTDQVEVERCGKGGEVHMVMNGDDVS